MSRYDLRAMTRRIRNPRRSTITFRDIRPPAMLATNLYQAAYADVIAIWSAASERIIAEYERTLSTMVTDSPADVRVQLDAAESELQRLFLLLTPRLRQWLFSVERWQRDRWRGAVLAATSVDLQTLIGPEDVRQTLDEYLEWNASLVKDVSAQARQRIAAATFSGLTQRKPAREVAKEIREAVAMSKRRATFIASDQLSKVSNALADERRREAGLDKFAWVRSLKLHPRASHVARDGRVYSDANPPPTMPGEEPNCGCRQRAVMEFS